jgi:hypothetical protein
MTEMLHMWMGCRDSLARDKTRVYPWREARQTAAEGVFPSWGRPTDKKRRKEDRTCIRAVVRKRQQKSFTERYEMKIES